MSRSVGLLLVLVSLTSLVLMSLFLCLASSPVRAQTVVPTKAYMSVEPNPALVLQPLIVILRIDPPPPSTTDRFTGLIITDLSLGDTSGGFGPYFTDSNGSVTLTNLVFTHVGTYKLQLIYAGESFTNGTIIYEGATSAVITLNVVTNTPTPTPEPTSTPTPTSEPTPTPFASPTLSPTATPSPTQPTSENSESFQTMLVLASLASVAGIGAGLLLYLKKRRVKSGGAP